MLSDIEQLLLSLSTEQLVQDFYFVGGTALGYYLDHRVSYDIDLIRTDKLDPASLMALSVTYDAQFVPDKDASRFRINTGNDLREYKMMFTIGGIKVEFFYPNDPTQIAIVNKYKSQCNTVHGIQILPLDAIAQLKLLAFLGRRKIRDLFDIFILVRSDHLSIETIDKYTALKYDKTFVEYVEAFSDDKSESLDFDAHHEFEQVFAGRSLDYKERFLKEKLIEEYTRRVKQ